MQCSKCGAECKENNFFCENCGAEISTANDDNTQINNIEPAFAVQKTNKSTHESAAILSMLNSLNWKNKKAKVAAMICFLLITILYALSTIAVIDTYAHTQTFSFYRFVQLLIMFGVIAGGIIGVISCKKSNKQLLLIALFVIVFSFVANDALPLFHAALPENNSSSSYSSSEGTGKVFTTNETTTRGKYAIEEETETTTKNTLPTRAESRTEITTKATTEPTSESTTSMTMGEKNALKKAYSYLNSQSFSRKRLIEQLEYEGFTHDEAVFAVDNCNADWNEQAVKKAKSYLEFSSFSKSRLIEQLEYEGFTHDEAVYGVEQNGY